VLVDHLWPERSAEACRSSLYSLISRLRGALQKAGLPKALVRMPSTGAYRLDVDPDTVDFHRFRRLLAAARDAGRNGYHESCVALLDDALAIWRDEPLADLHGAHAEHLRRAMEDALLSAYKCLAESKLQIAEYDSTLAILEPILPRHDLDETLAQYWIAALSAIGRESDARAFFTIFRQRFRRSMRTEPSIELPHPAGHPGVLGGSAGTAGRSTRINGPRQLPSDIADFTGHPELLSELDALIDPTGPALRVIVLSGMPGVGKTTLAVHWAHGHRNRFPDGQLHINAGGYGPAAPVEPAEMLGQFLYALDVPAARIPTGVEQRRDRLNQLLATRRVLIVLDNMRDSEQVRPLLPTSETCRIVITSRNRLRGLTVREGVRNITVPPLPDETALALLSQVVGANRTQAEPAALAALARLSGGLPLAVRIIGEHVAARPRARISEVVEDLEARLLDCEGEDDDEATLRTVFAWSHLALRSDAAALFDLLGLYPGETISVEAAAALAGAPAQPTEQLLNALAKSHLINHDTIRRYRFHDLVRRYAADRAHREVPAERRDRSLRRLLDWFLLSTANAKAILVPHQSPVPDLPEPTGIEPQTFATDVDAMRWCEAERSNLGAVTRWAVEQGWYRHGWQIPGTVHEIFDRYGPQDDLRDLEETALRSARIDAHRIGELGIHNILAATYFGQHDYTRAARSAEAGLNLARDLGRTAEADICLHNLAAAHLALGDSAFAVRILEEVLGRWRETGDTNRESATLHRLGEAYRQMHLYDKAAACYRQALAIRERSGWLRAQCATHVALATLFLETRHWQAALEHCARVLANHEHTKDDMARCDALTTTADVQRETGLLQDAIRSARLAVALSEDIADPIRRCRALTVLAHALAVAGHSAAADRASMEALTITQEATAPDAEVLRDRLDAIRLDPSFAHGFEQRA